MTFQHFIIPARITVKYKAGGVVYFLTRYITLERACAVVLVRREARVGRFLKKHKSI